MCRAVGMVQTPGGVPFEQYVQDAFRTELLVAGLASDSAPVMPMGHLERMHFSTSTEASWELRVTLASSSGRRLTIAEDYAFNWHLIGAQACRETSFGGKWSGSGRGEIVDRRLILRLALHVDPDVASSGARGGGACRRTADESELSDRFRTGVNGP
jgi:hypothetical protein